jgi:hypothetical protein
MSLRNGLVRIGTRTGLDKAFNTVRTLVGDEVLELATEPQLAATLALAERVVAAVWQRRTFTSADVASLDALLTTCECRLVDGAVVVQRPAAVRAEYEDFVEYPDPERHAGDLHPDELIPSTAEQVKLEIEDGLLTLALEGWPRDLRACLWCGGYFRADRASALFDRTRCRVAFHRACATAAGRDPAEHGDLRGFFRCVDCGRSLTLDLAAGLVRNDRVFLGAATDPHALCLPCARRENPDWTAYLPPAS